MNIGIVTTWFERGGGYVSKAYYNTLSKQHKVYIFARGGEEYAIGDPNWDFEFVRWSRRHIKKGDTFISWDEFLKWIIEKKIDIVIFNEQQNWEIILKCQKLNIPIGSYIDYYTKSTHKFFYLFDFLLCNTFRHYSVFQNHPQSYYIPWGTYTNIYKPRPKINHKNEISFFHSAGMSRVNYRKGTDILIRAFTEIKASAKLIIHSQLELDDYGEMKDLIVNDPRIKFINKTVSAPGLYHLGNVYVYPSRLEGIGLTIIEALSCGLPVITTNSPPMNEFVVDHINGRLIKIKTFQTRFDDYYWPEAIVDVDDLRNIMQFYIDNPKIVFEQAKNARDIAKEKFDWEKNSEFLIRELKQIKIIRNPTSNFVYELKTEIRKEKIRKNINKFLKIIFKKELKFNYKFLR